MLEQEQPDGQLHPVAYVSRTLSKSESRYGITELEALALVWAAKHFRAYLPGHPCTAYTDHTPLQAMLKAKHSTGKMARWASVIAELDLDIRYCPGRVNSNADALSRSPLERQDGESEVPHQVLQVTESKTPPQTPDDRGEHNTKELVELQEGDPELMLMRDYLLTGALPSDKDQAKRLLWERERFVLDNDVLYYVDPGPQKRLQMAVPQSMRVCNGGIPLWTLWWTFHLHRTL